MFLFLARSRKWHSTGLMSTDLEMKSYCPHRHGRLLKKQGRTWHGPVCLCREWRKLGGEGAMVNTKTSLTWTCCSAVLKIARIHAMSLGEKGVYKPPSSLSFFLYSHSFHDRGNTKRHGSRVHGSPLSKRNTQGSYGDLLSPPFPRKMQDGRACVWTSSNQDTKVKVAWSEWSGRQRKCIFGAIMLCGLGSKKSGDVRGHGGKRRGDGLGTDI
jgi:hypothetical protein